MGYLYIYGPIYIYGKPPHHDPPFGLFLRQPHPEKEHGMRVWLSTTDVNERSSRFRSPSLKKIRSLSGCLHVHRSSRQKPLYLHGFLGQHPLAQTGKKTSCSKFLLARWTSQLEHSNLKRDLNRTHPARNRF